MYNNVKGYPNYYWDGRDVWNILTNRCLVKTCHKGKNYLSVKLKNSDGVWKRVTINTVEFLSGRWDIPIDFKQVPHTKGKVYINEEGVIYSCQETLYGVKVKPYINKGLTVKGGTRYPIVRINYKGVMRNVEVHQLMCVTFYDDSYVEKGLVCLHIDNDKTNYKLSNLKIGTYSENNKQAYDDGINRGNVLGINK